MRGAGLIFCAVIFSMASAYFFATGFSIETTVTTADAPAGYQGISNLQLMHVQTLDILIGTGAAIIAAIFLVGSAIAGAITDHARTAACV